MLLIIYIILGFTGLMAVIHLGIRIEKGIHWLMRKRGVTEVTAKQNKQFAKRYRVREGDKPTNRLKKRK